MPFAPAPAPRRSAHCPQHYRDVYRERLYPHLRPEQKVLLLPFAAYCELGCQPNTTIAGPHSPNCSDTPWGECWTGCPAQGAAKGGPPWPCAGGATPPPPGHASCNACTCNAARTSCGDNRADARCLQSAEDHLAWAEDDPRVVGLFVYRLKDLWQASDMSRLDACQNPFGTGLGLVDRCGVGGVGGYATPQALAFYQRNVSEALARHTGP